MSQQIPCRALTVSFPGTAMQITSKCRVSAAMRKEDVDAGLPHPRTVEVTAAWDTGATSSAIADRLATALGLKPTGMGSFSTAAGEVENPLYNINILLPGIEICSAQVSGNRLGALDMLIGMDIISMGDFHISNHQGKTVMTFRIPSLQRLDYCEELREAIRYKTIHESWIKHGDKRCPCGSGKPWEKCHGIYG